MEPLNNFLAPTYRGGSLHQYALRRSILAHLQKSIVGCSGCIIDVGCGSQPYRSILQKPNGPFTDYVGVDRAPMGNIAPDLLWDGHVLPVPDASFDTALCTEVLEHTPDPKAVITEIYRVLKPGGTLILTTPFFWVLHEVPNDYQRLTPFSLDLLVRDAGFSSIQITALGGFDASLGQMLGLWIELRPMKKISRFLCQAVLGPVVWLLHHIDQPPPPMERWTMYTGFAVIAKK